MIKGGKMNLYDNILKLLNRKDIAKDPKRTEIIEKIVNDREAIITENGALATWTEVESTGRSPKDTVTVKRDDIDQDIDWHSPNNIPITEETFDMLFQDAIEALSKSNNLYITNRTIGADASYSLPVKTISNSPLVVLFTMNMFRNHSNMSNSIFNNKEFYLLALPYDKLQSEKYEGRLRKLPNGKTSNMAVAFDYERRVGIVYGSAYCGSIKKMMFTVMNHYLPKYEILPLHCSANEGDDGKTALFLGLSGTGKTTLSTDPQRSLIGDDEHGWSENGIANFENGCYAKMININPEKEEEIYNAVMFKKDYKEHGVIIENAMVYPNGKIDFNDNRLTENSRASYPLKYLSNVKLSSKGKHPSTILFLTADANGVLPPVAKLNKDQAMLWFMMGYTSKTPGTETGITEPITTFSRFFGQPFMPNNPDTYAQLLGKFIDKYNTEVYLINTGWIGGPYGVGKRIDIAITRKMVNAALNGELKDVEYKLNDLFHIYQPTECPGVDPSILDPKNTWKDKNKYDLRAKKLAKDFSDYFDKMYKNKDIPESIEKQCPGK
jgi:phosphoenolpyruvate carboxykinase (ATP)